MFDKKKTRQTAVDGGFEGWSVVEQAKDQHVGLVNKLKAARLPFSVHLSASQTSEPQLAVQKPAD